MTHAHLRLVAEQPTPTQPSRRRAPSLTVIDWTPDPLAEDREWRTDEQGRALPRTGKFERIRLSLHHATKAWREIAGQLDAATDALAITDYSDEAVAEWRRVASRAITAPWAPSMANNLHNLRARIALASVMAGSPSGRLFGCEGPKTQQEVAFAVLDHAVYRLVRQLQRQLDHA